MKNYILFLLLPGILLMSCEKDGFLDRVPKDALSEPGFFKNENDLKLYANRFYPLLPIQQPATAFYPARMWCPPRVAAGPGPTSAPPIFSCNATSGRRPPQR
jgi:hypothetical protein